MYENILSPTGVTTDNLGNVYVATFSDNSIIKISPDNKRTVFFKSSQISGPISLASDSTGNIYVSNYSANNVLKITPTGVASVLVDRLDKPYGLHVNGNMLFITCQGSFTDKNCKIFTKLNIFLNKLIHLVFYDRLTIG